MKVADILKSKGNFIFSTTGNTSVFDALKVMSEKNIGSLMVIENEKLIGIFTERDYARKIILQGKSSLDTQVYETMTTELITVQSEDLLDTCMELMSKNHVRHLPVLDNQKVTGIISITDVVTAIIERQKETITYLQNYISQ